MTFTELTQFLLKSDLEAFETALDAYLEDSTNHISDTNDKNQTLLNLLLQPANNATTDFMGKLDCLIAQKISLNTEDSQGFTPLIMAIISHPENDYALAKSLVAAGADICGSILLLGLQNEDDLSLDMDSSDPDSRHPLKVLERLAKAQAPVQAQGTGTSVIMPTVVGVHFQHGVPPLKPTDTAEATTAAPISPTAQAGDPQVAFKTSSSKTHK